MQDRDPNIVHSELSRTVTDGVTLDGSIYRLELDPKWALEVINNPKLVKAIKAARPVGQPMTADQAKAWLATR